MPKGRRRSTRERVASLHPEVIRLLADIHQTQAPVPLAPLGAEHAPSQPDRQCFWCLGFFGPARTKAGETWSGYEICRRCADTVDARRTGQ